MAQAKQDTSELEVTGKGLKAGIVACEERMAEIEVARDAAIAPLGNLVHDSVPVDNDEVGPQTQSYALISGGRCDVCLRAVSRSELRIPGALPSTLDCGGRPIGGGGSRLILLLKATCVPVGRQNR